MNIRLVFNSRTGILRAERSARSNPRIKKRVPFNMTRNFWSIPAYSILQQISMLDMKIHKRNPPGFRKAARNYYSLLPQDIPLYLLEFEEFYNAFEDYLWIQEPQGLRRLLKKEVEKTIGVKPASQKATIDGVATSISIILETGTSQLKENFKKQIKKPFDVYSIFWMYKTVDKFFGAVNKASLVLNPNYKKIMRADPKRERILKYFNESMLYRNTTKSPREITYSNLLTLLKNQSQSGIKVNLYSNTGAPFKYMNFEKLLLEDGNEQLVEKALVVYNNDDSFFEFRSTYYFFDPEEVKKKHDDIFNYLMKPELQDFIDGLRNLKDKNTSLKNKVPVKKLKETSFTGTLQEHQEEALSWAWSLIEQGAPGLILADEMGMGKALENNTPIKIPGSWKKIKNIKVNDYVIGRDGFPTRVTGVYPQGIRQMYKIIFDDGREIEADAEHLWTVFIEEKNQQVSTTKEIMNLLENNKSISIPTIIPESNIDIESRLKYLKSLTQHRSQEIILNDFDQTGINELKELIYSLGGTLKIIKNKLQFEFKSTLDIKNIEPSRKTEATCISVDNQDKLFVAKDYITTHNTISTISFLSSLMKYKNFKTILIICPSSVVSVWENELARFDPKAAKKIGSGIQIMSYERAIRNSPKKVDLLILDEAQKIKNNNTLAFKNISLIEKKFVCILTGTPIENKVDDLFSLLQVINPSAWHLFKIMKKSYKDVEMVTKIREVIDPIYLQRHKTSNQLKAKMTVEEVFIPALDIEKKITKEIKKVFSDKMIKLNASNNHDFYQTQVALTGLLRLRQAVSLPSQLPDELIEHFDPKVGRVAQHVDPSKAKKLVEIYKKIHQNKQKVVVFTMFSGTIKYLKVLLEKNGANVLTLSGQDSSQKRKIMIEEFQRPDSKYDVFIIMLKAGNSGITLTNANNVVLYDLWYNPAVVAQALARVHRIGQQLDVTAYILITQDSVDEAINKIFLNKNKLIDAFSKPKDALKPDLKKSEIANFGKDLFQQK